MKPITVDLETDDTRDDQIDRARIVRQQNLLLNAQPEARQSCSRQTLGQ
ncbi:hypothetical protein [Microcella sp.]